MIDRQKQFEAALNQFPQTAREILQRIPRQAGRLFSPQCAELMMLLDIDAPTVMARLLPLAKAYAVALLSGFQVGAVAMTASHNTDDGFDLYMGANMEFIYQPLNQTIHAEQAAALYAWHQGAYDLQAVAASEAPCGHCRQFLYEFQKSTDMLVIIPNGEKRADRRTTLSDLLPAAFGPLDLDQPSGLMSPTPPDRKLELPAALKDRIIARALSAAAKSYAPYTGNLAGCAVQTQTGEIYSGRYAESAAYNPSVAPLQSAALCLNMASLEKQPSIQRVVLAERPTTISQRRITEMLLDSWAPGVALEYFEIK